MSLNKNTNIPDYFSDDEVAEQDNRDIMDDYPDDEYEIDEETRRIIYENAAKNINRFETTYDGFGGKQTKKSEKTKSNIDKKSKNVFNLAEFNKKLEDEANAKKPKKFVSKRADEKRKQLGIDENSGPKRSFNPKKPPYNFVKSHDKKEIKPEFSNLEEFPSL